MSKTNFDLALKIGSKKLHINRQKLHAAAHKYYKSFRKKNGKIHSKFLENRNCPLCKKNESFFLFIKDGGNYVKCKNCQLIYSDEDYISKSGFALGAWVRNRRNDFNKGKLSKEKINKLTSYPKWSWSHLEAVWLKYFNALKRFENSKKVL